MDLPRDDSPVLNGIIIQLANFFNRFDLNEEQVDLILKKLKYAILKKNIIQDQLMFIDNRPMYIQTMDGVKEINVGLNNETELIPVYNIEDKLINKRDLEQMIFRGNSDLLEDYEEDDDEEYLRNIIG